MLAILILILLFVVIVLVPAFVFARLDSIENDEPEPPREIPIPPPVKKRPKKEPTHVLVPRDIDPRADYRVDFICYRYHSNTAASICSGAAHKAMRCAVCGCSVIEVQMVMYLKGAMGGGYYLPPKYKTPEVHRLP